LLILLGAPIGLTLAVLPIGYILFTQELPLSVVPYQMYEALDRAPLLAIPLFLLTGELMNTSQMTDRLLALSRELVGRIRGGLAQVNIVISMLFAGMNGSAVADTATVGAILIPAMKKAGYSAAFSAAVTAISSTIGGIIPPSIVMVLLASGMGLSVGGLFAAGIIPGILIGAMLMGLTYFYAVARNYERNEDPFSFSRLFTAFNACAAALTIPIVLVGGIVFGVFTATEAGAITAGIALVVGSFVYRTFTFQSLGGTLVRVVKLTAGVFIIIAAAGPFSWLLNRIGALQWLEGWLVSYADTPLMFCVMLVGFIFIAGMVMDAVANIIVLGPTLVKAGVAAGFPELQVAIVVSVGFLLGTVTPPIGVCYFTAAFIANERLEKVAAALVPFILLEVAALFLLLWIPALTMWLPGVLGL
ncbi:MAG: TRAP transporter large permease, partial [Hyphomicrobiales bacterium]